MMIINSQINNYSTGVGSLNSAIHNAYHTPLPLRHASFLRSVGSYNLFIAIEKEIEACEQKRLEQNRHRCIFRLIAHQAPQTLERHPKRAPDGGD